jgi:hypothetical protein
MRPLSATECITPAIDRTKLVLFTPFRKGRTWKLCATAYLCRMGKLFFPFPLIYLVFLPAAHRRAGTPGVIGLLAGLLVATALFCWLFHLGSRLQFAFFDIVVNRGEFVAPAWRKYPQALRWTGVKVVIGTAIMAGCAVPMAAYVRHLMPIFRAITIRPGQPPPPHFLAAIFAGYGLFFLVFGPVFLISSLLSDFLVPSFALEDTTLGEAFRRMLVLIRQEPGEFILYVLLKVGLAIALYMGVIIAWEIAFVFLSLIVGLVVFLAGFLLHLIGVPSVILSALGVVLLMVWYGLAVIYSIMFAMGPVFTFLDAFALYFLGGRYPMLGDMLDRSTPPPTYAFAPGHAPYPQPYYPPQPGPPPSVT